MKLRFGKLTLALPHEMRNGKTYVLCRCDCGADAWMRADKLERRASCGCLSRLVRAAAAARTVSRRRTIPEHLRMTHSCWSSMRNRCSAKTGEHRKYYGARGVRVCDRWSSFWSFVEDMGPRPSPKHSIDRFPDKNGNYEPGNCRWATPHEQQSNRRPRTPRVLVEHEGEMLSVFDIRDRTGLSIAVIRNRIRLGWGANRILTEPVRTWWPGRKRAA